MATAVLGRTCSTWGWVSGATPLNQGSIGLTSFTLRKCMRLSDRHQTYHQRERLRVTLFLLLWWSLRSERNSDNQLLGTRVCLDNANQDVRLPYTNYTDSLAPPHVLSTAIITYGLDSCWTVACAPCRIGGSCKVDVVNDLVVVHLVTVHCNPCSYFPGLVPWRPPKNIKWITASCHSLSNTVYAYIVLLFAVISNLESAHPDHDWKWEILILLMRPILIYHFQPRVPALYLASYRPTTQSTSYLVCWHL